MNGYRYKIGQCSEYKHHKYRGTRASVHQNYDIGYYTAGWRFIVTYLMYTALVIYEP